MSRKSISIGPAAYSPGRVYLRAVLENECISVEHGDRKFLSLMPGHVRARLV